MVTIRIVEGTGAGPTELAAFDSALAAAGVERYNLIQLSSVIPRDGEIVVRNDFSPEGSVGDRLHVVKAAAITEPNEVGAAGLAWARTDDGRGIFYEAAITGSNAASRLASELDAGLDHGLAIRSWSPASRDVQQVTSPPQPEQWGCAIVLAAYGSPDRPW